MLAVDGVMYQTTTDLSGSATMEINTHLNAGTLAKDVSLENESDTALRWQWRVDQLPSAVPEDSAERLLALGPALNPLLKGVL
jgi:hypothetical protein